MKRKVLLSTVVMLCVTLVTTCVATRFFMSFEAAEQVFADTSYGAAVVESMAGVNVQTVEDEVRQAWSLAEAASIERAKAEAAARSASEALASAVVELSEQGVNITAAANREEYLSQIYTAIDNEEISYKKLFKDTCIIGDSIIAAISLYDYIAEPNCMGKVGASLYFLQEKIDTIVDLNPKFIVLHFGMNMLNTSETYLQNSFINFYVELLEELTTALPNAKIVISGLFPITEAAEAREKEYRYRDEYNAALRAMCVEHNWQFLDNDTILGDHMDMLSEDGMHPIGSFYTKYWLKYVISEVGIVG